jgi:hypothetical protein
MAYESDLAYTKETVLKATTFAIGLVGTILIVLIAGAIARNSIVRKLLGVGEGFLIL